MNKKIFKAVLSVSMVLAILFSAVPAFAVTGGTGAELYKNTMELIDGFYYTNAISMNSSGKRVETFTLETTATGPVYPIVLAKDKIHDTMDINGMTAWAESHGYNVHAAINADFFYETYNYPLGGVIQDGRYISSMNNENLLAFSDLGAFYSRTPTVTLELHNLGGGYTADPQTGAFVSNAGKVVTPQHLNKVRTNTGGLFLYTSDYHDVSTCTSRPGWGVRFRIVSGELTVSGRMELEVVEVVPDGLDYELGEGYMVLTAPADNPIYADYYNNFAVGDRVELTTTCSDERLTDAKWACGCGDILAENGSLTDKSAWDKAITAVNPRTGLGIKPDGSVIAYVVDGRRGNYSNGALMEEMATDLLARGCVDVVNLDGGGSSTMSVRIPGNSSCAVVNYPSGGKPRKCGSYILFVSDRAPDGMARSLHLEEDGAYVLAGSALPVNVTATDYAGMPVSFTDSFTADCSLGSLAEGFYTAGPVAGVDSVELRSAYGVSGHGSIHVIDTLDTLTVLDAETGKTPALMELEPGDTIQLTVSGTRLSRSVAMDMSSVDFSVTEGLGEMTEDGYFTFTGQSGAKGEITVRAGGLTVTVPVGSKLRFTDTSGHWAEQYINTLYDNNVVTGVGDMMYRPSDTIKRCDFTVMLWRSLSSPGKREEGEAAPASPFEDVAEDQYFYDAVVWAANIGIVNGVGNGRFDPKGELSREQAFTMVYRLLTVLRKELPAPDHAALSVFSDAGSIDGYALDAMASLTAWGLITGDGGNCSPLRYMTRGEMAKVVVESVY